MFYHKRQLQNFSAIRPIFHQNKFTLTPAKLTTTFLLNLKVPQSKYQEFYCNFPSKLFYIIVACHLL